MPGPAVSRVSRRHSAPCDEQFAHVGRVDGRDLGLERAAQRPEGDRRLHLDPVHRDGDDALGRGEGHRSILPRDQPRPVTPRFRGTSGSSSDDPPLPSRA